MAFPGTYNFNYYRGDTAEFVIRPKNSNGTNFDLTGYDAVFTISNRRGPLGVPQIQTASVNSETDIVTCNILPNDGRELAAGTYVYDVEIENGLQIYTLLTGTVTVTDDISGAA